MLEGSTSEFDKEIFRNFQIHLRLTLLGNPHLFSQSDEYQ